MHSAQLSGTTRYLLEARYSTTSCNLPSIQLSAELICMNSSLSVENSSAGRRNLQSSRGKSTCCSYRLTSAVAKPLGYVLKALSRKARVTASEATISIPGSLYHAAARFQQIVVFLSCPCTVLSAWQEYMHGFATQGSIYVQ